MIRKMELRDRKTVLGMMRGFYDSPAVAHTSSDAVLEKDVDDCIGDEPLIEGFVFEEDGRIVGYSMASQYYNTEYGGRCIFVEDLFLLPEYRGGGRAGEMFAFLEERYPDAVRFKLEVEPENENAVKAYLKNGYLPLDYTIMAKNMTEG